MTNRAAAKRYARALFDVARAQSDPSRVEQELAGLVDLTRLHPTLEKVLGSPAIPVQRKRAVIDALIAQSDMLPIVAKTLALLAERDRLVLLPDILDAYRERLRDHLGIVRAEITTAAPLAHDRALAVERGLSEVTGKQIDVVTRVDPALIGGVVAKIGSTLVDGSVKTQLERMKEQMAEGA